MSKRKFYQKKRIMIPLIIALALILLGVLGAFYSSMYISTTSAYVDEYSINISPKISSKIIELNLNNDSIVKKGEIVAELDSSEYISEIKNLETKFEDIEKELKSFDEEISKANAKSKQTKDTITQAKLNLENANGDYIRYKNEFKDGTVTKRDLDNAINNLELAQEQYQKAQDELKNASESLKTLILKKDSQMNETKKILEDLQNAKLELTNATLVAPKSGKIINLNAKVGDIADNNKVLFSILPDECFIIANFKKLPDTNIKLNQKAKVQIYSMPFKKLDGEIVEISEQKQNYIQTKIKIDNSLEKYNLKSKTKAFVRVKIK